MQMRSGRSWTNVDDDDGSSSSALLNLNGPQHAFEYSSRTNPTSTITINQNIQTLRRIEMRNRQISVHRLLYELSIPTTTVYQIISNHWGTKKVSTRWVSNIYSTLSRESEGNPNNYFHRIVTGDETWVYYDHRLSEQEAR